MARKWVLNEGVLKRLVQAWELGTPNVLAAKYAGISKSSLYEAIAAGQAGDKRYARGLAVKLVEAMDEAQARAAMRWMGKIEVASKKDWRAAAWMLERRYPEDYGRGPSTVQVQGPESGAPPVSHHHVIALPDQMDDADEWEQAAAKFTASKAAKAAAQEVANVAAASEFASQGGDDDFGGDGGGDGE